MARKAIYKHATQVNTATYPDDGSSPVGSNEWNESPDAGGMLGFTPSTKTIATGKITPVDTITIVAAESGTSDDLDLIIYSETNTNDLLYLFADTGDTITVRHNQSPSAGESAFITIKASNITLSETVPVILQRRGTTFYQITEVSSGDALVGNPLSQFAATTSAQLAGVLSDETGSGSAVFATSPTLVTPALGTPVSGVATNLTGTASSLTSGNVTTNANLTGDVTSTGNATSIASGVIIDTDINASAGITLSKLATDPLARANHTGTQTASTVSDFDTEVSNNTSVAANTLKTGITSGQASAITANTSKVTNATHTGDVTGATALSIASGVVTNTHLAGSIAQSKVTDLTTDLGLKSPLANPTFTGTVTTASLDVAGNNIDNIQNLIHDTSSTTTALDFNADQLQTISISANTTFTTSNRAIGSSKTIKITTDATLRTLTFPAWKFVGAKPTDQAASKVGILTVTCFGTADTDIVAAYAVEA